MKVAITGETGFLGYHLRYYYSNKATVVQLGRDFLTNLHLLKDCDLLIHAAGVNRASNDDDVYWGNVNLAQELVDGLVEQNIHIPVKYISSIRELEDTPYGRSKIKAKQIIREYCMQYNTKFESYQLPNLFGTHGKPNYNSFVNTFAYSIVHNIDCKYNSNVVNLCWVYDAILVIDNQTTEYVLYRTKVNEVYYLLKGLHDKSIEVMGDLSGILYSILNYYKNEYTNLRT